MNIPCLKCVRAVSAVLAGLCLFSQTACFSDVKKQATVKKAEAAKVENDAAEAEKMAQSMEQRIAALNAEIPGDTAASDPEGETAAASKLSADLQKEIDTLRLSMKQWSSLPRP